MNNKIPKKRIYISLPITGIDIDLVQARSSVKRKELQLEGYEAITPFDVSSDPGSSYAYHMGKDIQALLESDAVYFCRGWQGSKGCQAEYEVAKIYGKQMIFE